MHHYRFIGACGVVGFFNLFGTAAYAATPTIENVGGNGGAINSSDYVVGAQSFTVSGSSQTHATFYAVSPGQSGSISDLGTLPGGTYSAASGVNAFNQVVGSATLPNPNIHTNGATHAFLYTGTPGAGGQMVDLGTLSGATGSQATAINNSGQITGYSGQDAFLYTGTPGSGGSMADLGTLGGTYAYGPSSKGQAINSAGQIVGYSYVSDGNTHAFLYTGTPGAGGQMIDLHIADGGQSKAGAINDAGQIAGDFSAAGNYPITHGFLYTGVPGAGGHMTDLGAPGSKAGPYTLDSEQVFGMNNKGDVVGETYAGTDDSGSSVRAFLYTNGQPLDLNALFQAADPTDGAHWLLQTATAISDDRFVVGNGYFNGVYTSYRLNLNALVPEPASLSLLAMVPIVLSRRRRR